ncbi:hypothetical protein PO909_000265 [Leuciscus waleckii]
MIPYCLFCILSKLGVVNWSAFSRQYRQEFRVPYSLTLCLHCTEVYKDCPPGSVGDGRSGVLRGLYSEKEVEGYCSVDCFFFRLSRLCVSVRTRVSVRTCVSVYAHIQIITYINCTHTHMRTYTHAYVYCTD